MIIANDKFALPYDVVGLQYLNFEGKKFSKSQGVGVFCENLEKAEKQIGITSDYWRFYLTFLIPENRDSEFFWKDFKNRINGDLIGNFANLVNRVLNLVYKNNVKIKIKQSKFDNEIKYIKQKTNEILGLYDKVKLRNALKAILELSSFGNKYVDENQLWKQKDNDKLSLLVYLIKDLSILLLPIIPKTVEKISKMLNYDIEFNNLNNFNTQLKIEMPGLLFKKIDDDSLQKLKLVTSKVTKLSDYFKNDKNQ
jgi:methionyl-tRNA synthetase